MPVNASVDQVAAFVVLAQTGSLRAAALKLNLSEQGLRSRLLALEAQIGRELYRKAQGARSGAILTAAGLELLPHAQRLVDAAETFESYVAQPSVQTIRVAASEYLIVHFVTGVLRDFRLHHPDVHVRVSSRTAQAIEDELPRSPDFAFGIAALETRSPVLRHFPLLRMQWGAVIPTTHRLATAARVTLSDLAAEELLLFEAGSVGRRTVLAAFAEQGLYAQIAMELTHTDTLVAMARAGLGITIVPLLPAMLRSMRDVVIADLSAEIEPLEAAVVMRPRDVVSTATQSLIDALMAAAHDPSFAAGALETNLAAMPGARLS
jgi:DNA-binding transcriptional LysR family regulator